MGSGSDAETSDDARHDGLFHEPRLLGDVQLLGALHAELAGRHAADQALHSLFQLGLLHGLRDALHGARFLGDSVRPGADSAAVASLLPIALEQRPRSTPRGEVALIGIWPAAREAEAHRMRLGTSDRPCCGFSAGYTAGWYSGLLERDLLAIERTCVAAGDEVCRFELRDAQVFLERRDPLASALLADLPFSELRALALRPVLSSGAEVAPSQVRDGEPIVHVWGPVMVIPFAGADAAIRGLDLIGRDPAARDVTVVVLDLSDVILDEGFGAADLEHVVGAIEGWGAEPILAGVSPLSEAAVADLVERGVNLYKDVPLGVAAAFQIARSQGRTV